jgi:hypothetical protein
MEESHKQTVPSLPAEFLISRGDCWKGYEAEIVPVGEYPAGVGELGYLVRLRDELLEITPGTPCMVSFFQEGDNVVFNSRVLASTGRAIYVSIPSTMAPDRRKRRLDFNIPARLIYGDAEIPSAIVNISEDWTGLGIQTEAALSLPQGAKVRVEFNFNGQAMAYIGTVVWADNSHRFGLAKCDLHIW